MSYIIALEEAKRVLLRMPGVLGVGWDGKNIVVYVESEEVIENIPSEIRGFPVVVKVTGPIRLLK